MTRSSQLPEKFVYLDEWLTDFLWDSKYATGDNFTGAPVDGYATNRIVCTQELAVRLQSVNEQVRRKHMKLLVYDAYRPMRAVRHFIRWSREPEDMKTKDKHYPAFDKTRLFDLGYIAECSGHSRGGTIDLTLTDENGVPLDMGGEFDFMDPRSRHNAEGLPAHQAANRKMLRSFMEANGFVAYGEEWWHYRLQKEPYPDKYFDFVIA